MKLNEHIVSVDYHTWKTTRDDLGDVTYKATDASTINVIFELLERDFLDDLSYDIHDAVEKTMKRKDRKITY